MKAHQRFAAFVTLAGRSQVAIAADLEVDPTYIPHLAAGRKRPGLRLAAAIEQLTRDAPGGAIKSEDWLAHEPGVRPRRPAQPAVHSISTASPSPVAASSGGRR